MKLSMAPSSVDEFRMATRSDMPLSLRRRKCGCGKTVTAKQMQQYGCCDKCRVGK